MSNDGSKKIKKKKTSTQKSTNAPVYNEEIVFTNIKKDKLADLQIQLSIYHDSLTNREPLGFVSIGSVSRGNEHIQWKDMCDGKKSIAWWQTLHQAHSSSSDSANHHNSLNHQSSNEFSLTTSCLPSSSNGGCSSINFYNHNGSNANNTTDATVTSSSNHHHQHHPFKGRSSINAKLRKFLARSTSINR